MKQQIINTITAKAIVVLFSMGALFPLQALSETLGYVSDELTVPMRSGTTNQHRIIRFIKSGTPLKVLETSEDGSYSRVSTPDEKEGWVENIHIMNQRSARDRLVSANNKLSKTGETIKQLKKTIAELRSENNKVSRQLATSEKKASTLEDDIAQLKKVTANPLALADKNRSLQEDLNAVTRQNEHLKSENKRLSDNSAKDWFIVGGAVSMGSLLFGLLITRIRWQKKRGWSDF